MPMSSALLDENAMPSIEKAIAEVPGTVGVSARHLNAGVQVRHNADMTFFTASTLKVPLLELYRQVDEGKVDLSRRMGLTDMMKVTGSGVLKELEAGLQPTIHDLAMLMIVISDNTATDILYEMVGRDSLNANLRELGLTKTRIPMSTRELHFSVTGLDPRNPSHTYEMVADRLFKREFDLESDALDEEKSDVSCPDDMCALLELVHRGEALSPSSREGFFGILKRQQLNSMIPLLLPSGTLVAHKTGAYDTVRCDVGIVYSLTGPYAIAIMAKQIKGERLADLALASVSRAVYDEFNP